MGEQVNPKAKAYATCDSLSSKGEGAVSSCKKGMDVCLGGSEGTFKIDTDAGTVEVDGEQQKCIAKIKKLTDFGYVIAGGVFKPPKVTTTDSETEHSASDAAAEPTPTSETEPPVVESKPPAGDVYAGCKKAGSPGSEEHGTCVSIVDTCQASSEGPYKIFTDAGVVEPNNQTSCMKVASALAKMGYKLVDPSNVPDAEDAPDTPPTADAKPDVDETGSDEADDESDVTFVKSFADINLRLKVTGDSYATEKRKLHFKGGKGIPIKLEYKIEKLENGSYSMDYTVYKGKNQIGDEESITFEANDGKIDLGFKVKLYDPDDFGSIESITIVEL